ncbi:uncharacterized protein LOC122507609 [Leptopilina heterotoma]|uniref:uncharacterized protein LOC122507609 n=1 Tax=Leptopilina heterotoma TaxID=63436 RepID=UPI001CA8FE9B|nr:uncharacterized protein LOC122507609 [Leptopilina heterotoma]
MAFANRLSCYICNRAYAPNLMARIDGDVNDEKRLIAIARREELNRPALVVTDRTRLCINCNQSVTNEIRELEQNPSCLRLNVLTQTANGSCLICNGVVNIHRLSLKCRINVFLSQNIYIPANVKSCDHHLNNLGLLLQPLLQGLRFVNRPYRINRQDFQPFFEGVRNAAVERVSFIDIDSMSDEDFRACFPVSKDHFEELYNFRVPVPRENGHRYVTRKDLLAFLCKMRQGLPDKFLKVMFNYPSRQSVSLAIATVRQSLMLQFVPQNIGFHAITPNQYIEEHVTEFANELYNPDPNNPKVISVIDGTYVYCEKSSNFRTLRQTFCLHKGSYLVKPDMIVAPNGYILTIQGPYFSDGRNNDAAILRNEFNIDGESMREWFPRGFIMIVDRGYRDVTPLLTELGIDWRMPPYIPQGQNQLSTEEANESRLITKNRWVVESVNGHMKTVFKFLAQKISITHLHNLQHFLLICGAILNRYYQRLEMEGANAQLARQMLQKSREPNIVQAYVELEELHRRNARRWILLNDNEVPDFPRITLEYLKGVTFGEYQIELSPAYIQDKLQRENDQTFQLEIPRNQDIVPGLIRVRILSRFRNAGKHQLWMKYKTPVRRNEAEPIEGYYCTCRSGARTLGTCAHITSVLWYLGYARHEQNIRYPSIALLNIILDAANRPIPEDLNQMQQDD